MIPFWYLQVPSVRTIEALADQMQIHPLTLIVAAYCEDLEMAAINNILQAVKSDFKKILPG